MCVFVCASLTSAPPVSGVCMCALQVWEAVGEVLVVAVFGLLDHLVFWMTDKAAHTHTHAWIFGCHTLYLLTWLMLQYQHWDPPPKIHERPQTLGFLKDPPVAPNHFNRFDYHNSWEHGCPRKTPQWRTETKQKSERSGMFTCCCKLLIRRRYQVRADQSPGITGLL